MRREKELTEFAKRLQEAAGANLVCAILYGSAASDEFHEGYSDLNVLCVLRDVSGAALHQLSPAVTWWTKHRNPAPVILASNELPRDAEMFAIEMLDIKRHHRVLAGDDVFGVLEIPMALHRIQLEHELRTKLQLLRQQYAAANDRQTIELMANSLSGFVALFRHALLAMGAEAPHGRMDVVNAIAQKLGFESAAFSRLLQLRRKEIQTRDLDAHGTFAAYESAIEKVVAAVAALPYSRELCG
jgi:hypothetical protein